MQGGDGLVQCFTADGDKVSKIDALNLWLSTLPGLELEDKLKLEKEWEQHQLIVIFDSTCEAVLQ